MTRLLLILLSLLFAAPALAQEEETEVRSRFTQFVENQLSTENRQIRLNGIQGALSSEAVIREITIADREGVWLTIANARIEWTRRALLLGRLEIDRLAADSIEIARKPLPDESAPAPEASGGFALPELPVSIRLDVLEVPQVTFGPTVFGLASSLSVNGGISLAGGALEASLDIERLDGPGGQLALAVAYANETEVLDLDLSVSEPEDGIVANLLGIEGRPAVDLTLAGSGPISDLQVDLTLDAGGERIVTGVTTLEQTSAGLAVNADVEGPVARLIAPAFRDFFGANTDLQVDALLREGGGLTLNALSLNTGSLTLNAAAETSPDNFLRRLQLEATIDDAGGEAVVLPVAGGDTTLQSARLAVDFGAEGSDQWGGSLQISDFATSALEAEDVSLDFGGTATGLDQPEERRLTFMTEGGITGITTDDPAVASALGDRIDLVVDGEWAAGAPIELAEASITGEALSLDLSGVIEELVYDGSIDIEAASIAPFADLAGRPLAGAIDLDASGTLQFVGGGFDLTFDGTAEDLEIGTPAVDALIESTIRISGRLARGENGFEAGNFSIGNDQFSLAADGVYASDRADLTLDIMLADLALVSDRLQGRLDVTGTAQGEGGAVALDLQGSIPSGELAGRTLTDATLGFIGNVVGADPQSGQSYGDGVQGQLSASAALDGEDVSLAADIFATGERQVLENLQFDAGEARLSGNVTREADGLVTGAIDLRAPDISTLAALALTEATGSANAAIVLSVEDGRQDAEIDADVAAIRVNEIAVDEADVEASIVDLFGLPKIEGAVSATGVDTGSVTIETLSANAARQGATTEFDAEAALDNGADLALAGELEEIERGFRVALERLLLTQGRTEARLLEPVTVLVEGETIELGDLALDVGGGRIRASGTVAETLDLDLSISQLPLAIANSVMPDLEAAGTIDGTARVTGPRAMPDIVFDITGNGLSAAPLAQTGLSAVDIDATGRTVGESIELDAALTAEGGIAVDVSGSVPMGGFGEIDLDIALDDFPLASVDALAGDRGLEGALSANAAVGGTFALPDVTFDVTGSGLDADQLAELGIGPLAVEASGRFADQTVTLGSATISDERGLNIVASGTAPIDGGEIDLDVAVENLFLDPFADLAGRPLGGTVDLSVTGTVDPSEAGFDLTFDGTGEDLETGAPAIDALVESAVSLSGRLARDGDEFQASDFAVANEQFSLTADGVYSGVSADFALEVALSDLALVSEQAAGELTLTATASGALGAIALDVDGNIPSGELAGRNLRDATFGFSGEIVGSDDGEGFGEGVDGQLTTRGFLDGEGILLSADLFATAEAQRVENLDFTAGGARIAGGVARDGDGLLTGTIDLAAPNISTLAALALTEATGSANASLVLSIDDGSQNAEIDAEVADIRVNDIVVDQAAVTASLADLFGVLKIEGAATAAGIVAGGVTVESLSAEAVREEATTDFSAEASLDNGTDIALAGSLAEIERGLRVALDTLSLTQGETQARLVEPVTVVVEGQTIVIGALALNVDGGEIRASGTVADTLDLDVSISQLPLAIANTVMPDLAASGVLDATATISGRRARPDVVFDIAGSDLSAAPLREAGLSAIDIDASGRTVDNAIELDAEITADGGITVTASGSVPMSAAGALDLDVRLNALPLASVDALAGNRGLQGTVSATASVSGAITAPDVTFDIDGNGVSADQLAGFGIQPLALAVDGRFSGNTVTLSSATIANGQGLDVAASGTVPLSGSGLNVQVQGNVPLSLADAALAERGTSVTGTVGFSVAASGSIQDPQFNGMVSTSNAGVVDPEANVQLENINLLASIQGQQVTINTLQAGLSSGGTIVIGGTISLDAAAAFPANITIALNETRYADGDFLVVTASGNLSVTGPLARDPVIAGTVNIERAEIGIPEGLGGAAVLTDVRHIAPPPAVQRTLERAGTTAAGDPPVPTSRPSIVRLDITINAPNQIFIRGRGLDAELGGSITIQGPVTNVEPVGSFELIRGRLSILGRRITFDEGSNVTLIGDLDPFVNLTASSQSGDTTVGIAVTGRASDISIDFTSQPELPQDEVIARLIFDRGISELSPFQIAQLAAAVAELTGGGNTSLLGQLRQSTGLDDLDVVTDEEGNAAVRAGRYIRDNIYLGVQAGAGGSSEVTVDIDITDNLKARGAAGADGDTSIGLFYEKDY